MACKVSAHTKILWFWKKAISIKNEENYHHWYDCPVFHKELQK